MVSARVGSARGRWGVLTFNSFSAFIRLSLPFGFGSKIGPSSSASALVFLDEVV